jgi:hypothetical protein
MAYDKPIKQRATLIATIDAPNAIDAYTELGLLI